VFAIKTTLALTILEC